MLYAIAYDDAKITPEYSGQRAICPACRAPVVARCGVINVSHWSHLSGVDCDSWAEPLSSWHIEWQGHLAELGVDIEKVIEKNGKKHRADAVWKDGTVIELQHSSISVLEIREREAFYEKMLWVFDVRAAYESKRFDLRERDNHFSFRWKHARKSIAYATKPVRLDLGRGKVFQLSRMSTSSPCGGWGKIVRFGREDA